MLIGQKQNALAALPCPSQRRGAVGRRADDAAALADERFDRGRRVDVGDRHHIADAHQRQLFPAGFELIDGSHVGHRAPGREIREDNFLVRRRQHVGALGHEVHAAENDELGLRVFRDFTRKTEGVADVVRELDHLVALVVMAEDDQARAQRRLRGGDAAIELLVGQTEISLGERLALRDMRLLELR